MVDGVLASCYASTPDHDLAHIAMTPLRWFPGLTRFIFGSSSSGISDFATVFADVGKDVAMV